MLGIGLLGRDRFGAAGGLLAALFLAVVPWHLHFSRIAFELIAFPALFVFACAALVGGRARPAALAAAGRAAVRAVPLRLRAGEAVRAGLPGSARWWSTRAGCGRCAAPWRWRWLLTVLTALPVVVFDSRTATARASTSAARRRSTRTSRWQENAAPRRRPVPALLLARFLFERGDPIIAPRRAGLRRAVLDPACRCSGSACCGACGRGRPEGKLLLWWLAALSGGAGADERGAERLARLHRRRRASACSRRRAATLVLDTAARADPALAGGRAARCRRRRCWRCSAAGRARRGATGAPTYHDYPAQAAADFQYGYRETIEFMEATRKRVRPAAADRQPRQPAADLRRLLQRRAARRQSQRGGEHGYLIIDPGRVRPLRDEPAHPGGAARGRPAPVRRLHRAAPRAAAGRQARVRHRRGARPQAASCASGCCSARSTTPATPASAAPSSTPADVQPRALHRRLAGATYWRRRAPQFVRVDLNGFFRPRRQRPASRSSGCAATPPPSSRRRRRARDARDRRRRQALQAWVNGQPLTERMVTARAAPQRWPIAAARRRQRGAAQGLQERPATGTSPPASPTPTARDLPDVDGRPGGARAGRRRRRRRRCRTQQVDGFAAAAALEPPLRALHRLPRRRPGVVGGARGRRRRGGVDHRPGAGAGADGVRLHRRDERAAWHGRAVGQSAPTRSASRPGASRRRSAGRAVPTCSSTCPRSRATTCPAPGACWCPPSRSPPASRSSCASPTATAGRSPSSRSRAATTPRRSSP